MRMPGLLLSPRFPFDPARLPFYYGWLIAVVATAGIVSSIPGQTMGVSVFTDDLLSVTGLSRLEFSNSYLTGTLISGLLLPFGGRLLDRYGSRLMGAVACFVLAATLLLLSGIDRLTVAAGPFTPGGVAIWLTLSLLFVALRFSGQGLLTLTARTMLARWFDRKRGLVTASSGAMVSFGFAIAPVLLLGWKEQTGWQSAWREMALVLLGMGLVALFLYRDTPEDCGLRVDGQAPAAGPDDAQAKGLAEPSFDARSAVATVLFWVVTLGISNMSLVGTALTFHIVDLGAEAGLEAAQIVRIFFPIAAVAVSTGFLVGYLIDRRPILSLVRVMLGFQLVMFVSAAHLDVRPVRLLLILTWGVAAGFFGPMTGAALPRLFGRLHLGSIAGVMTSCLVMASALGPAILALFRQLVGSYRPGLYVCCGLPILVFALSFASKPPHPRETSAP